MIFIKEDFISRRFSFGKIFIQGDFLSKGFLFEKIFIWEYFLSRRFFIETILFQDDFLSKQFSFKRPGFPFERVFFWEDILYRGFSFKSIFFQENLLSRRFLIRTVSQKIWLHIWRILRNIKMTLFRIKFHVLSAMCFFPRHHREAKTRPLLKLAWIRDDVNRSSYSLGTPPV